MAFEKIDKRICYLLVLLVLFLSVCTGYAYGSVGVGIECFAFLLMYAAIGVLAGMVICGMVYRS